MTQWFTVGDKNGLNCCRYGMHFKHGAMGLDHQPSLCDGCGVECVLLNWDKNLQIVTMDAPPHFQAFIRWAQDNLDEFEFIDFLVCFEEIAEKIYSS